MLLFTGYVLDGFRSIPALASTPCHCLSFRNTGRSICSPVWIQPMVFAWHSPRALLRLVAALLPDPVGILKTKLPADPEHCIPVRLGQPEGIQ